MTTLLSVGTLLGEIRVFPNLDGTISVDAWKNANGELKCWREVGPLVYREVDGGSAIAFTRDPQHRLILVQEYPIFVAQRVSWLQSRSFGLSVLFVGTGILLLALLFWPIGAVVRRHYGKNLELEPGDRNLRRIVRLLCAVDLAFLAAWSTILLSSVSPLAAFLKLSGAGRDSGLYILAGAGVLVVAGAMVAVYYAVRVWADTRRALWNKLGETAVALASLGVAWFTINWHLLSFRLSY